MDKIIKDLTEATTINVSDWVEVQKTSDSVTKKAKVGNLTAVESTARAAMDNAIIEGTGLASDGTCSFSGTNYLNSKTNLKSAIESLDTLVYNLAYDISLGNVVVTEVDLTPQDLTQLNAYPVTLLEFGAQGAGQTSVYMPIAAMFILYQDGNALVYGEEVYIGYSAGGDPAIPTGSELFKIPRTLLEDSSGNNVPAMLQNMNGAATVSGIINGSIVLYAKNNNHSGGIVTSTAKVILIYQSILVTASTAGT